MMFIIKEERLKSKEFRTLRNYKRTINKRMWEEEINNVNKLSNKMIHKYVQNLVI